MKNYRKMNNLEMSLSNVRNFIEISQSYNHSRKYLFSKYLDLKSHQLVKIASIITQFPGIIKQFCKNIIFILKLKLISLIFLIMHQSFISLCRLKYFESLKLKRIDYVTDLPIISENYQQTKLNELNISQLMSYILLVLALCSLCISQTPPIFPNEYQIDFDETAKFLASGTTKGTIYFDVKNNKQLITRQNGKFDRYCGSVFKTSDTPCNHYTVEGKRFLDFPKQNYCCFCCDSTHGCGIVAPDWLVKGGAKFNGTEQLDSAGPYLKWEIKGGQENYYYHKNDTLQTPRRLNQVPEDLMDFKNYKVGPVDPKVFELPSYCTSKCGALTICAGLRGEM